MSHIYDALNKSHGDEPERRKDEEAAAPPPPAADASPITPRGQLEGQILGEPNAEFLRELDTLRANMEVLLSAGSRRVIVFLGAVPDEGVTTVAVHFAYLLANVAQKHVLLVDGDMAPGHPSLSDAVAERDGLTELLRLSCSFEDVILGTEEPTLHFLPAGRDRVNRVEAISTGPLAQLFEQLGQRYDYVVVDCAAVLEHPEAPVIGAAADGVVLVVRAHRTRREIAQRVLAELNFSRCRILGTVLNAHKSSLPRFLRERV